MLRLALIILLLCCNSVLATDLGNGVDYIPASRKLGVGTKTPSEQLSVNGSTAIKESTTPTNLTGYGKIYVASGNKELYFLASDQSAVKITNNGSLAVATGTVSIDDLSDGKADTYSVYLGSGSGNAHSGNMYNTALGINALRNSDGDSEYNTAVGYQAMYTNNGGDANTAVGRMALYTNTTGSNNVAIGLSSLYSNTTGYNNIAVGHSAMSQNTTGYTNVAIGGYSGGTTGYENVFVGISTFGSSNATGYRNTGLGYRALSNGTTNQYNVAVGYRSSDSDANATGNTTVGSLSLFSANGDGLNTAIGYYSMYANTNAQTNTAVGAYSLYNNQTGQRNTALGYYAGYGNGSNSFANGTLLGYYAGQKIKTGSNNTLVGFLSGNGVTTGANNITLGYKAGNNISTGSTNIIIGSNTDAPSGTASNQLDIGDTIYADMSTDQVSIGTTNNYGILTLEGSLALDEISTPSNVTGYGKVYVDSSNKELYFRASDQSSVKITNNGSLASSGGASAIDDLSDAKTTSTDVYLGNNAGANDSGSSENNTAVGINALSNITSGDQNTAIGYLTLNGNTSGTLNTAMGGLALALNIDGSFNTSVGQASMYANTSGSENTAVGLAALNKNTTGKRNTAIGSDALSYNTNTGNNNTSVGQTSLYFNTIGNGNSALGRRSLYQNTNGNFNVAAGIDSLYTNKIGSSNVAIGGYAAKGPTGNYSTSNGVFLGFKAGESISTGKNNIMVGYQAGNGITTGDSNIVIGYNIDAPSNTASNQLDIGDTIYADMSTDQVSIGTTNNYGILTLEGSLALDEISTPSNVTGYGKVYVDSSNKELYFRASDQSSVKITNNGSLASSGSSGATNIDGLSDGKSNLYNLYIGNGAGFADNGTGYNTGVGYQSLSSNVTPGGLASGLYNSAFGYQSLRSNTNGDQNTAIGYQSMYTNISGSENTSIGSQSLYFNTSGILNTALGSNSLNRNTSGSENTASGYYSLYANTTGTKNTALGGYSLFGNSTGYNNTAVGYKSITAGNYGHDNTALGYYSLYENNLGTNNVAIGSGALYYNGNGSANTAIGSLSGGAPDTASFSNGTLIGYHTGFQLTTGNNNTFVGYMAGNGVTTGSSNIIIGHNNDAPSNTTSNQLDIGDTIYADMSTDQVSIGTTNNYGILTLEGNLAIKEGSAPSDTTANYGRIYVNSGNSKLYFRDDGGTNYSLTNGYNLGTIAIDDLSDAKSNSYNVYLGNNAGNADTGTSYSTGLGIDALKSNVSSVGEYNSALGYQALYSNTNGDDNTAIGHQALYTNVSGRINTAIGSYTLYNNTSGSFNTATGRGAMYTNTTGQTNTATGYSSLFYNTSGSSNTGTGHGSLYQNTTGDGNTSTGQAALYYNQTGSNNIAIGKEAAYGVSTKSHSNGIFLGYRAGYLIDNGDNNIFVGYKAGDNVSTGSTNIIIGYNIDAPSATASNQLDIGDTIYADMSTDQVSIGTTNNYGILTLEGNLAIKEGSAPSDTTTNYGRIYVNSGNSKLYFRDDGGTNYNLTNGSSSSVASGTSTWFQYNDSGAIAGNGAIAFTKASKTLTIPSDAPFDINSTTVSIADTDITLDGASTTFTQTTGAMTLAPANGSNLNVTLLGVSDFAVDTNKLFVNNNGNVGIGYTTPNQLLSVNGAMSIKEGSAPSSSSNFGKIYANSSNSKLYFLDDSGTSYNLTNGSSSSVAAGTSTWFQYNDSGTIAGNGAIAFTKASKTLTIPSDAPFDINSTTVSIADTDITLDGASTTFTQSSGAITMAPANGSNMNINLLGVSDFAVDTNKLFVNNNGNVGIGYTTPNQLFSVNGAMSIKEGSAPSSSSNFGKIYANSSNSKLYFLDDSGTAYNLTNGSSSSVAGGSNTYFQYNDSGSIAGNGAIAFTKASKTLTIPSDAPLDINSTTVSIADTNISFDGASTTFTGTGAMTITPGAGTNLNVSLSTTGDFAVNTNQLYVDTSATNVGIGTSTPSATLDVESSAAADGIDINNTATDGDPRLSFQLSGTSKFTMGIDDGDSDKFKIGTTAVDTGTMVTIDASGNVGIGITTPTGVLQVSGDEVRIGSGGTITYATGTGELYVQNDLEVDGLIYGNGSQLVGIATGASDIDGLSDGKSGSGAGTSIYLGTGAGNSDAAANTYSVAVGYQTLYDNSSGDNYNSALGYRALYNNDGDNNTAVGYTAMQANSGGYSNTAVGAYALMGNTGGRYNTAIGSSTMTSNNGDYNTAIGNSTLVYNDSGVSNTAVGSGAAAGTNTYSFSNGAFLGKDAANNITSGDNNIAIGFKSAYNMSSGANNIIIGYTAADALTTGSSNIIIGYNNDINSGTGSNQLDIADTIFGNTSTRNIGIGINTTSSKLTVNGEIALREGSAPSNTSNYGKIYVQSSNSKLYFKDDAGTSYNLTNGDAFSSSSYLRSDASTSYTSGTLTINSGTTFDINSTNVSIADTDVSFDGGSTTLTSTGAWTLTGANGSNINVNLLGVGDFVVDTNKLIVNNNGNVGIGYTTPNQLLSVNGAMSIKEGSAPSSSSNFGKLYANSSNSKLYFLDDSGTAYNLTNGAAFSSASYLRADATTTYSSGTITFNSGTTFDINSTAVSIADTDITLDGASTTFTQTTGAITMAPANGSNMNINLLGVSDFAVDTNKLFVNNNGNVGIGYTTPNQLLSVNGAISIKEGSAPSSSSTFGKLYANSSNSKLYYLDDSGTSYNLTNGAVTYSPGGSNKQLQYNNSGAFGGAGQLYYNGNSLGISVSAPQDQLHVANTGGGSAFTRFSNSDSGSGSSDGAQVGISGTEDLELRNYESKKIIFYTNNTQRMEITSGGRVGVGVASPSSFLFEVNGGDFGPTNTETVNIGGSSSRFNRFYTKEAFFTNNGGLMWGTSEAYAYKKYFSLAQISNSVTKTLVDINGDTFSFGKTYKVTAYNPGTATLTGAIAYFVGNGSSSFELVKSYEQGTGTEDVEFYLSSQTPKVRLYAGSTQRAVQLLIEEIPAFGANNFVFGPEQSMYMDGTGNIGIRMSSPSEKLTLNGSLALKESSASTNTTGYGKLYVDSGNKELYFRASDQSATKLTNNGSPVTGLFENYFKIADEKSSGTASQSTSSGAWRARDLNTEVSDVNNLVTINAANNGFTLQAGTYYCIIMSPIKSSDKTRIRLASNGTAAIISSGHDTSVAALPITATGQFTVSSATTYKVQYYSLANGSGGDALSIGINERYTEVECWKKP